MSSLALPSIFEDNKSQTIQPTLIPSEPLLVSCNDTSMVLRPAPFISSKGEKVLQLHALTYISRQRSGNRIKWVDRQTDRQTDMFGLSEGSLQRRRSSSNEMGGEERGKI